MLIYTRKTHNTCFDEGELGALLKYFYLILDQLLLSDSSCVKSKLPCSLILRQQISLFLPLCVCICVNWTRQNMYAVLTLWYTNSGWRYCRIKLGHSKFPLAVQTRRPVWFGKCLHAIPSFTLEITKIAAGARSMDVSIWNICCAVFLFYKKQYQTQIFANICIHSTWTILKNAYSTCNYSGQYIVCC